MLQSMTGFGQSSRNGAGYRIQVDLKSVNHRYSEVMVRMPREWISWEDAVRKKLLSYVKRGRIDAFITMDRAAGATKRVVLDGTLARGYVEAARLAQQELGFQEGLSLRDLFSMPEMIQVVEEGLEDPEAVGYELLACVEAAAEQLTAMRSQEGQFLKADLDKRLHNLKMMHAQLEETAPLAAVEYREKLKLRMKELLDQQVEESRLMQEVALFADRSSIAEELTRLSSHMLQFARLLESPEQAGRKLDFLIQEMNREINTIGSKGNYAELAIIVVDFKAELEKIREQVQNIE